MHTELYKQSLLQALAYLTLAQRVQKILCQPRCFTPAVSNVICSMYKSNGALFDGKSNKKHSGNKSDEIIVTAPLYASTVCRMRVFRIRNVFVAPPPRRTRQFSGSTGFRR